MLYSLYEYFNFFINFAMSQMVCYNLKPSLNKEKIFASIHTIKDFCVLVRYNFLYVSLTEVFLINNPKPSLNKNKLKFFQSYLLHIKNVVWTYDRRLTNVSYIGIYMYIVYMLYSSSCEQMINLLNIYIYIGISTNSLNIHQICVAIFL